MLAPSFRYHDKLPDIVPEAGILYAENDDEASVGQLVDFCLRALEGLRGMMIRPSNWIFSPWWHDSKEPGRKYG